jgi:hypothetical protein
MIINISYTTFFGMKCTCGTQRRAAGNFVLKSLSGLDRQCNLKMELERDDQRGNLCSYYLNFELTYKLAQITIQKKFLKKE